VAPVQDDVAAVAAGSGCVAEHLEAGSPLVARGEGGSGQGERAQADGEETASHVKPGRGAGR
jgi:hypothetical protein